MILSETVLESVEFILLAVQQTALFAFWVLSREAYFLDFVFVTVNSLTDGRLSPGL